MLDLRPVGYVVGLLVMVLGAAMVLPLALDVAEANGQWPVFAEAAIVTALAGGLVALSCASGVGPRLTIQQTFLLTSGVWLALPVFGAIPFMLGATEASFTDAYFEAMSGLTTTGATVLTGLDELPPGLLLWRGILQWIGGIGIIVVAMVFLPELRVGGMQIFRSEGFDTFGKILPRAGQIASRIGAIYLTLTGACAIAYAAAGMDALDAVTHAMTTIATGGFANYDASFGAFGAGAQYVAVLFMLLAALPFVRYVQLTAGTARPLLRDPQIRAFLATAAAIALALTAWRMAFTDAVGEEAFRSTLFNTTSVLTGTGYASRDYMQWGALPVAAIFFTGLIGGCAGSTACSIKVFRYQLLLAAIRSQIRQINQPHGVFQPRYEGRPVTEDVLSSVTSFFVLFIATLATLAVVLGGLGLDFVTAVSGAAAALANIGPGLGDEIGPAGNYAGLSSAAKWVLAMAMLAGRLELLAVFVIFTPAFWRA
jgi:trk system potassium uptake protein TrkH